MNQSEYEKLVETSWRRPLTPDEQRMLESWLAQHPEASPDSETEHALHRLLAQIRDVPLASNFTSQVLAAVAHEPAPDRSSLFARLARIMPPRWRHGARRLAWAALILLLAAGLGYWQRQRHVRTEMAQGLAVMADVAGLSDPAVLQDFDVIQRLAQTAPGEDEELFFVLTK